mgnify:CR=1 FL=1
MIEDESARQAALTELCFSSLSSGRGRAVVFAKDEDHVLEVSRRDAPCTEQGAAEGSPISALHSAPLVPLLSLAHMRLSHTSSSKLKYWIRLLIIPMLPC